MTTKEYLSQAYRLDQRINSKIEQLDRLRATTRRTTVSYGGERVSSTRNVTSMEDTIIHLMESEHALNREIDRFVDTKWEIQQTIDLVAEVSCRLLLELRYLCMMRWEEIAGEMGICRAYTYRLHHQALDYVETILMTWSVLGYENKT
jgi:DNA-directed RNA polymerase specialized sigma subunit